MAARVSAGRRVGESLAIWLCAWLVARETLCVLFAFHPLGLLLWSGVFVLLLRLWARSTRTRIIGFSALVGGFFLLCLWPAAEAGGDRPLQKVVAYCFDFAHWVGNSISSTELPLHPDYGAALWLLIVLASALVCVLLLDVFNAPVVGGVALTGWFTALQLLPYVQDRQAARLLWTLLAVLCCCAFLWSGKRWEQAARARSYGRWQRGMALLLLPALIVTGTVAGLSEMNWRSDRFSGGVDEVVARMEQLLSTGGGTYVPTDNLERVALGGERRELGVARFDFEMDRSDLVSRVYLRTAVFDRYTGYHWQRTLDTEENAVSYPAGSPEFADVLQGFQGVYSFSGYYRSFTIRNVRYATTRPSVPLGTYALAAAWQEDIDAAGEEAGGVDELHLTLMQTENGPALSTTTVRPDMTFVFQALPAVGLTANAYGEVTSEEALRRQYLMGEMIDLPGAFFSDGAQKPWSATLEDTLAGVVFGSYELDKTPIDYTPYLALPETLAPEVRALARQLRVGGPYQTALALRSYLRSAYSYTLTPATTEGDFVTGFLFDVREGYCTSFASAMVVLARCSGIPARYVEGYALDRADATRPGGATVTDKEKHAWAELYFPGAGWLTFDATSFVDAVTAPLGREDLELLPEDEPEDPEQPDDPEEPEEPDEPDDPEEPDEPEQPDEPLGGGAGQRGLPGWLRTALLLLLLAAAGYGLYRLRLRAWAAALRRYRRDPGRALAAYWELRRCAGALGCVHTPTQTVDDYFAALGPMGLTEAAPLQCERAARAVNTAAYGGRPPEPADAAALAEMLYGAYRRLLALRGKPWLALWWRRGKN